MQRSLTRILPLRKSIRQKQKYKQANDAEGRQPEPGWIAIASGKYACARHENGETYGTHYGSRGLYSGRDLSVEEKGDRCGGENQHAASGHEKRGGSAMRGDHILEAKSWREHSLSSNAGQANSASAPWQTYRYKLVPLVWHFADVLE